MRLAFIVTGVVVLGAVACGGAPEGAVESGGPASDTGEGVGEVSQELADACFTASPQGMIPPPKRSSPPAADDCALRFGGGISCSVIGRPPYGRPGCAGQFIADAGGVLFQHLRPAVSTPISTLQQTCADRTLSATAQGYIAGVRVGAPQSFVKAGRWVCNNPWYPNKCVCQVDRLVSGTEFSELQAGLNQPFDKIRIISQATTFVPREGTFFDNVQPSITFFDL